MIKFPSINQFRNVVKNVRHKAAYMGQDENDEPIYHPAPTYPTLTFVGTVKLHGTNAAIVFSPEGMYFQSRERVIVPGDDNAGFAAHFSQYQTQLLWQIVNLDLAGNLNSTDTVAIYGEWCGGSIQPGVAITGLPKMFVVFAVKVNDQWRNDLVHTIKRPDIGIYNIEQFPKWVVHIDFERPEHVQNLLGDLTKQVEMQCPVGKHFGKEGIGEGIVWRCFDHPSEEYWFKVKGEKHSASKVKTLAAVDVEAIESINAFVASAVTESRLEQGLQNLLNEQKKPFEMTSMGDFIRWVHSDVMKEEADTIQANGFEQKKLGGPIALIARRWFVQKLNEQAMATA